MKVVRWDEHEQVRGGRSPSRAYHNPVCPIIKKNKLDDTNSFYKIKSKWENKQKESGVQK
ncbi:hypothetical protein C5S35_18015 [Candidatus Methanophagaceae archaeon]|nr:hypothetical protein C5S35_18015 [Methanophagales archaeon]